MFVKKLKRKSRRLFAKFRVQFVLKALQAHGVLKEVWDQEACREQLVDKEMTAFRGQKVKKENQEILA